MARAGGENPLQEVENNLRCVNLLKQFPRVMLQRAIGNCGLLQEGLVTFSLASLGGRSLNQGKSE